MKSADLWSLLRGSKCPPRMAQSYMGSSIGYSVSVPERLFSQIHFLAVSSVENTAEGKWFLSPEKTKTEFSIGSLSA